MTTRSYISGAVLRLALVAALILQGMIAGALATRMATAQAVAGPGDTVVICTPEGFKTVLWSDISDDQTSRGFGCSCPCAASCGSCGGAAPNLLAAAVDYDGNGNAVVHGETPGAISCSLCALSPGGARAPPAHST